MSSLFAVGAAQPKDMIVAVATTTKSTTVFLSYDITWIESELRTVVVFQKMWAVLLSEDCNTRDVHDICSAPYSTNMCQNCVVHSKPMVEIVTLFSIRCKPQYYLISRIAIPYRIHYHHQSQQTCSFQLPSIRLPALLLCWIELLHIKYFSMLRAIRCILRLRWIDFLQTVLFEANSIEFEKTHFII